MNTCLIIPCYNEAIRIQKQAFITALRGDEGLYFVFVNDGSNDTTFSVLNALRGAQEDAIKHRIHILSYLNNRGKSEAVRIGMLFADDCINLNEKSQINDDLEIVSNRIITADYLGFWDADLATPLPEIQWFYQFAKNESASLLMGSRIARLGANIQRTLFRHYTGRLFATLISQGLGWKVHDTQCGAKLFKPALISVCFSTPFKTSWLFDVEILLRLQKGFGEIAREMVLEIPIREWTDVKGSKIGWTDFMKVPLQIWQVFSAYKNK